MRIFKLIPASLCVVMAFSLPVSIAKPHEINTIPVAKATSIQAIQAPKVSELQNLATVDVEVPVVASVSAPMPDNEAKAFIYSHESGNSTSARNSIGCFGLGQSCDNGALEARCGNDYKCQDDYFETYCLNRYGSWSLARKFWESNNWW